LKGWRGNLPRRGNAPGRGKTTGGGRKPYRGVFYKKIVVPKMEVEGRKKGGGGPQPGKMKTLVI